MSFVALTSRSEVQIMTGFAEAGFEPESITYVCLIKQNISPYILYFSLYIISETVTFEHRKEKAE